MPTSSPSLPPSGGLLPPSAAPMGPAPKAEAPLRPPCISSRSPRLQSSSAGSPPPPPLEVPHPSEIHWARGGEPVLPTTIASESANRRRLAASAARASCIAAVARRTTDRVHQRHGTSTLAPRRCNSLAGPAAPTFAEEAKSDWIPRSKRTRIGPLQRPKGATLRRRRRPLAKCGAHHFLLGRLRRRSSAPPPPPPQP